MSDFKTKWNSQSLAPYYLQLVTTAFILLSYSNSAAQSKSEIQVGFDQQTDFNKVKTYYLDTLKSSIKVSFITQKEIDEVITNEFKTKGLTRSIPFDTRILIHLFDKNRSDSTIVTYSPEYPRSEKHTEGYIKGQLTISSKKVERFIEEWLIVTMLNNTNKPLWEAGYVIQRSIESSAATRKKLFIKSLKKTLSYYPPEMGNSK